MSSWQEVIPHRTDVQLMNMTVKITLLSSREKVGFRNICVLSTKIKNLDTCKFQCPNLFFQFGVRAIQIMIVRNIGMAIFLTAPTSYWRI